MNPDKEVLSYVLMLYSISIAQDVPELKRFVSAMSRLVENDMFNKVLRKTMKILDTERCGKEACTDWLVNQLFTLYKLSN